MHIMHMETLINMDFAVITVCSSQLVYMNYKFYNLSAKFCQAIHVKKSVY